MIHNAGGTPPSSQDTVACESPIQEEEHQGIDQQKLCGVEQQEQLNTSLACYMAIVFLGEIDRAYPEVNISESEVREELRLMLMQAFVKLFVSSSL